MNLFFFPTNIAVYIYYIIIYIYFLHQPTSSLTRICRWRVGVLFLKPHRLDSLRNPRRGAFVCSGNKNPRFLPISTGFFCKIYSRHGVTEKAKISQRYIFSTWCSYKFIVLMAKIKKSVQNVNILWVLPQTYNSPKRFHLV